MPEAQLDRFFLQVSLGYPNEEEEITILRRFSAPGIPLDAVQPVATGDEVVALAAEIRAIHVDDSVASYVVALTRATRSHSSVELGASPRASLALFRASQALAAIRGRSFVIPDDVKAIAAPALGHRLMLKPELWVQRVRPEEVVAEILETVPAPAAEDVAPAHG